MPLVTGEGSMRQPKGTSVINRDRYDAVLFDLDGVITNTAKIHAACWKKMFDAYLQQRATQRGEAFRPFDIVTDYRLAPTGKATKERESPMVGGAKRDRKRTALCRRGEVWKLPRGHVQQGACAPHRV